MQGSSDLREYLTERLSATQFQTVEEVLTPFYEAIKRSTPLPLVKKDGLTQRRVLTVLRKVWGSEAVREVTLLSRSERPPQIKINQSPLWDNLKERFGDSLTGLGHSETTTLALLMYQRLGVTPWNGIGMILFTYFSVVLMGREEQILKLEPLARLLPYALPVGEIQGQPGIWLVLVD